MSAASRQFRLSTLRAIRACIISSLGFIDLCPHASFDARGNECFTIGDHLYVPDLADAYLPHQDSSHWCHTYQAVEAGARDSNLREAAEIVVESLHLRGSHPSQGRKMQNPISEYDGSFARRKEYRRT